MDGLVRSLIQAWRFLAQLLLGALFAGEVFVLAVGRAPEPGDEATIERLGMPLEALGLVLAGLVGSLTLSVICEAAGLFVRPLAWLPERRDKASLLRPWGQSLSEIAVDFIARNREQLLDHYRVFDLAFMKIPKDAFLGELDASLDNHVTRFGGQLGELIEPGYDLRIAAQEQTRALRLTDEFLVYGYLAIIVSVLPLAASRSGLDHRLTAVVSGVCFLLAAALIASLQMRRRRYGRYMGFSYLEGFIPGEGVADARAVD